MISLGNQAKNGDTPALSSLQINSILTVQPTSFSVRDLFGERCFPPVAFSSNAYPRDISKLLTLNCMMQSIIKICSEGHVVYIGNVKLCIISSLKITPFYNLSYVILCCNLCLLSL